MATDQSVLDHIKELADEEHQPLREGQPHRRGARPAGGDQRRPRPVLGSPPPAPGQTRIRPESRTRPKSAARASSRNTRTRRPLGAPCRAGAAACDRLKNAAVCVYLHARLHLSALICRRARPVVSGRPSRVPTPIRRRTMSVFKEKTFTDRLSTSAAARQAMLEKFKARPKFDDPAVQARMAAQVERREGARGAHRREEGAEGSRAPRPRGRGQASGRRADRRREGSPPHRGRAGAWRMLAEQKSLRDARYAARKARKK